MSALRPLPPNPSLEYERKEARALLGRLHVGDADALARALARHPRIDASAPQGIRLADAQLVIAREYGFASWPKLVRYFGDVDRQSRNPGGVEYRPRESFDRIVGGLLNGHRNRRAVAGRQLVAYVPRFYRMPLEDVFASWRIVELCGIDPDVLLAEHDARRGPPGVDPKLQDALELAGDDAVRLGQSDIGPENLLFGLLRVGELPLMYFTKVSRMDLDRFRADVQDRVRTPADRVERPRLRLHADAEAMVREATAIATERRRETVRGIHLLYALTKREDGPVAALLTRYASDAATLKAELERAL
jgi:hypothetical protein